MMYNFMFTIKKIKNTMTDIIDEQIMIEYLKKITNNNDIVYYNGIIDKLDSNYMSVSYRDKIDLLESDKWEKYSIEIINILDYIRFLRKKKINKLLNNDY